MRLGLTFRGIGPFSGPGRITAPPLPSLPLLTALSLSSTTFVFGSPTNGTIVGAAAGSQIDATGLPTGLTIDGAARKWAWDGTGTSATGNLTLTETLGGIGNSPRPSIIPYTVISTTLGALTLSSTIFTVGSGASGTINGATAGSVISATGSPSGLTVNSAARTWDWTGIGSATDSSFALTETLSSAVNSPLDSTISYSIIVNDTTAPTLSSPTATETGTDTASLSVTTDEDNGPLYEVVTTSSTAPTKAQVKAGENNSGTAAVWSGSQVISSTGTKTATATGLTASTTYYAYFMHEDASGNQSDVAAAASFTTAAATGLGGSGTLSAPVLGYPSSQTAQPTLPYHAPVDWQSGDVAKLAYSASANMSSPTVLSHTLTDTDITNGSFTFPLPTLSALTFFQAFGSHSGTDSQYLSDIVAWGDTTAPTITTTTTGSIAETSLLAVALTATDSGSGVPDLVSDGTSPGWYIDSGTNQLDYQVAIVGGAATLQWYGNAGQSYNTTGGSNDHVVVVGAIDRSGNKSTFTRTETVTQIDRTPNTYSFTNVSNATRSTLYTSNTVTISGLEPGFSISSTFSGPGAYSKNGGAYVSASPFNAQNGDTFTLQATSSASYSTMLNLTLGIGLGSANWSVTTGGDPTAAGFTPSTKQPAAINQNFGSATSTFTAIDFLAGFPVIFVPDPPGARTISSVVIKAAGAGGTDLTCTVEGSINSSKLFTAAAVSAGSYDVAITLSASTSYVAMTSGTITNATSQHPTAIASETGTTASSWSASPSLTVASGGIGVAFLHYEAGSGQTPSITATGTETLVASSAGVGYPNGYSSPSLFIATQANAGSWTAGFSSAAVNFGQVIAGVWR